MKSVLLSLLSCFFVSFVYSQTGPVYWASAIPNNSPGNPIPREFQSLENIPGTSFNILFGGVAFNTTNYSLNDTWILDTSVPAWKPAEPKVAPPARAYHVSGASSNGEIIIFGGQNEAIPRVFFDDVWRYSLQNNTWTQDEYVVPTVLISRSFASGLVVNDTLYVFGGFSAALQTVTNDLWSYNLTTKRWALHSANGRTGAPVARQGHSAVYFNDTAGHGPSILFFGGYTGTGGFSDTWQFVIQSSAWIQVTKNEDPLGPSPRWGHTAFLAPYSTPTIIIFGGSFVGGAINPYYNDVWALSVNQTWTWTNLLKDGDIEGPWKRAGHSTVISQGSPYTFGGYGLFVGLYNDLWELFI